MAVLFGFSPGPACQWIPRLTPIVNQAVGHHPQLPARQPAELHAVRAACPGLEFLIEGAERPIRRPQNSQRRPDDSSGKKKRHTQTNLVITDKATGTIKGWGRTQPGRKHDRACIDEDCHTFPTGTTWDKDGGFQGDEPEGVTTDQPRKKPRGKDRPLAENEANRLLSRVRARVEHGVGGTKIFKIVHNTFRNIKEGFVDLVMETARGLFNLRLEFRTQT